MVKYSIGIGFFMTKNNNTLSWRVNQLECNYKELDRKMEDLLTNHFPSLKEEVTSLKTRISVLTVINVGAIVLALVFTKFL